MKGFQSQLKDIADELNQITGGKDLDGLIQDMVQTYNRLQKTLEDAKGVEKETRNVMEKLAREIASAEATLTAYRNEFADIDQRLGTALKKQISPV